MAKHHLLQIDAKSGTREVLYDVKTLLLAGFAGRDEEKTAEHVEELKKMGIPAPERTPVSYEVSPSLLTSKGSIFVNSPTTSGEVEYVLFVDGNRKYVGVGSDHTDRNLEKFDVQRSKEACPKVAARRVWPCDEVEDHWDDIIIRSRVVEGSTESDYQEETLEALLSPEQLLEKLNIRGNSFVLFSGTVPLKLPDFVYAHAFEMELYDPVLDRDIGHKYWIRRHRPSH